MYSLYSFLQQDYIRVQDLSECELQRVSTQLTNAPEVALTLTYTDGASLLTPTPGQTVRPRTLLAIVYLSSFKIDCLLKHTT